MARSSCALVLAVAAATLAVPSTATAVEPAAPIQRPSSIPPPPAAPEAPQPNEASPPTREQPDPAVPSAPTEEPPGPGVPTPAEGPAVTVTPPPSAGSTDPAPPDAALGSEPTTPTDPDPPAPTEQNTTAQPDPIAPLDPTSDEVEATIPPSDLGGRPYPGTGQITGGGVMIGFGTLTIAAGSVMLSLVGDVPGAGFIGGLTLATGLGLAGGGAGLVVVGVRNRRTYKTWRNHSGLDIPPAGNGMIVGGSVLAGVGLITVFNRHVLGGLEIAAGGALLGVGIHRHLKFKRTLKGHGLALVPTYDRRLRMGGLAVSGRF